MNKKFIFCVLVLILSMSVLVGCGSKTDDVSDNAEITTETPTIAPAPITAPEQTTTQEQTTTPEPTEAPHEHAYAEEITTPATCETDGVKTFTCECGDTYTETIATVGHVFENYISNSDATYLADGTETAKCSNCDVTDTRKAEGSMLAYTYTDMDATMYAQKTVNVRSMPSKDGEKLGSLSTNDEVKVTGQCAETSWYRIEYSGNVAYVSNSYLGNDKVVVQTEVPTQNTSVSISNAYEAYDYAVAQGYTLYQGIDNGDGTASFYYLNIYEVLPKDESDFIGNKYSAAWDEVYDIAGKYSSDFYCQYKTEHYATLGDGWTIRRFTNWRVAG